MLNMKRIFYQFSQKNAAQFLNCRLAMLVFGLASTALICYLFSKSDSLGFEFDEANDTVNLPLRSFEIARKCTEGKGKKKKICYSVTDVIDEETNTAKRMMSIVGIKEHETIVVLTPPNGLSTKDSDTRLWSIDHSIINNHYVAAMLITPFMVNSLNLIVSTTPPAFINESVLLIGLGGGALDMFLHRKRPSVNITVFEVEPAVVQLARRWFDVMDDENRRTTLGDGVEAIQRYSEKGEMFNVVFVDACNMDHERPCPPIDFLSSETLKNLKSILKPMGCLVLNVLALTNEDQNVNEVSRRLADHFPTCVTARFGAEQNAVFACLPYAIDSNNLVSTARDLWRYAWTSVADHFNVTVSDVRITVVSTQRSVVLL